MSASGRGHPIHRLEVHHQCGTNHLPASLAAIDGLQTGRGPDRALSSAWSTVSQSAAQGLERRWLESTPIIPVLAP